MTDTKSDSDIAFIRALAQILNESDLGEIEVSREFGSDDELKVRLSRQGSVAVAVAPPLAPAAAAAPHAAPAQAQAPKAEQQAEPADDRMTLPSPMVGTAYLAPEPGASPFVSVGDTVAEGQTVLIIEAMKTMNQIAAPRSGVVREIFVGDAEPVEFGSPLMTIV